MGQFLNLAQRWLTAGSWVYFTFLFGWYGAYLAFGDRFGYLAQLNALALYLFLPLPLVVVMASFVRRREVWLGAGGASVIFLWLWGGLLQPRLHWVEASSPNLTVLTYNVLGLHSETEPVLAVIRAEDADVVLLQELNTALAAALWSKLQAVYPYQLLDPVDDVRGMGVLSKHPIRPTGERLPLDWVGTPQILTMDWYGQPITLVNFHMWAAGLGPPEVVTVNFRQREAQARVLAEFAHAAAQRGPLIVAGDANATDVSATYKILTATLRDAWREGGFGFGHTFPGSAIAGSSRPVIAGWPVPQWLARIDYVFHSAHWQPTAAWVAQFDGVSDHRGVVAELTCTCLLAPPQRASR